MGSYLSIAKRPPQPESKPSSVLTHDVQAPDVSNPNPEQDRGNEETPGPDNKLLHNVPSSSGCVTHMVADKGTVITTPDVSNPECAGEDQGNVEIPGPSDKLLQDVLSSSGSVTHVAVDKQEETVITTPDVSDPNGAKQDCGNEEPGDQLLQSAPPSSGFAMHADENKEIVIANIQATDITLGLRRVPAGFYTVVHHGGLEWRTENKGLSANNDVLEWGGPIPLLSDPSAVVSLGIYASFEFQPTLGEGEQLRKLTVTVERLLDRSAKHVPFTFFPKDGDTVSPCSSLLVTVRRRTGESSDSSESKVLDPHHSTAISRGQLESATNKAHSALSRYRRHGERQDLDCSIEQFELALNICPLDNPCRAAAQANLALAKFICYRVDDTAHSLDIPLTLYRNALASRPVGHPDRPSTLIQLAAVHFARFEKRRHEVDAAQAEALLREVIDLSAADSHENRAAIFIQQLHAGRKTDPVQVGGQSPMERASGSGFTDEDPWTLSVQLVKRFEQFGDLADLQQAITLLEEFVRSTSFWDYRYPAGLVNLGVALLNRFCRLGELSDLEQAISRSRNAVDLTPGGHSDRPGRLSNLGNALLTRFRRLGQLSDLEQAISRYKDAVDITTDGHPDKPGCLSNLANSIMIRFRHLGELSDLEQAISRCRDAIDLTPDGHPDKPSFLNGLGNAFGARFACLGELGDLEQAILMHKDAVDLTPHHHLHKPHFLNSLATSFKARFERFGELSDLEQAISRHRDVLDTTPDGHPDKPGYLNNLGNALSARFKYLGQLCDLEQAISSHKDAVDLTLDGHPDRPTFLNNLGNTYQSRFERLGELNDLEQAISRHRDAVNIIPDGHPDKPSCLSNLASSIKARFQRLGELSDLEQAISRYRDAIDPTPDGHPDKPSFLNGLGNAFLTRFARLGELNDLEQAISRYRDAVDLTPDGHPDKLTSLNGLGNAFGARFARLGELSDLEQAISGHTEAVDLAPHHCLNNRHYLDCLASSLVARFERFGELSDLEQAISRYRDALNLTPDGHPDKPGYLNNLGRAFRARYECLGQLHDLEQAISSHRDAVDLTLDGHPDRPTFLNDLGSTFGARFERLGGLSDLEQAISRHRDAANLITEGHPGKPGNMNNLGNAFIARFEHLGELSDLEQAILMHRDAANLTPDDHPYKPVRLNNLGRSLRARFQRLGELNDLEQAILTHRDAVNLTPDDHPNKPVYLNSLGNSFRARFEHLREPSDLEQAISRHRDAIEFTPDGHPTRPAFQNDLGNALFVRFECLGELSDLEQAISRQKDVVDLIPHHHIKKSHCLNNLASFLLVRFQRLGEPGDLEQAISSHRDALDLIPDGHPRRPRCLNNLAISFITRFGLLGDLGDLEQAILMYRDAVGITPDGHPQKPTFLNNLGDAFATRFDRLGKPSDLEEAISLLSHVARASTGPTTTRFSASQKWISCARALEHHSLLDAYSVAIGLLPQLAWIGLPLTNRYRELVQGANVVREAAAAALGSGLPETAVEWLEQGRSIVWGELFQLRSSYDELLSAYPDHARRLQQLSAALELASSNREKSLSSLPEHAQNVKDGATESLEEEANRHRTLAIERDKLLQEIRRLPGFERFLLHKEFSQLRTSAHSGPVVILNAAESRCDALIILADVEDVIHVPLPNFTLGRSAGLQNAVKSLLGHARVPPCKDREGDRDQRRDVNWESVLSVLWNGVVKPVLDALAFSTPGDLSRIFWCPTGPFAFLPIHAAGLYGTQSSEPGHKVFDFVVSSYTPTLSILAPSPEPDTASSNGVRLLTVRQPPSDGLSQLPGVDTELNYIKAVAHGSPSARLTLLESSVGTVEEVLALMKEADWVHFACHGTQDAANPTDSGLCLANRRRLKLTDIIALSRPRGGLAFLSACQTAMGDEKLSDEAIHIAAGMLFAGYGGVVGTMWSISDRLAPEVAMDIYEQLFRNGARPDYREAARALHDAVGRLRASEASFVEWLPFIHVGL